MNKRIHRLVLDRRRGMLVPAAETTRSAGKSASGASRSPSVTVSALLAAGLAAVAASSGDAQAAAAIKRSSAVAVTTTLPQAVSANNARAPLGNRNWVQSGAGLGTATMSVDGQLVAQPGSGATPDGALMLIRQTGLKAILNWDSFNIGAGKTVEFRHDSSSASTLNYIWSADPTVVRGNIKATSGDDGKGTGGEVILQNTNGVIFANGARVDTGRFVATALSLSQDTFLKGLRNVTDASVVFGSDAENSKGFVLLEQGAEIRTAAGGDVLLIAPRVLNEGRIETPSGQTVMAAGQKVYMATSQDATQRGLVVTVSPFAADGTDDINTVEQGEAHTYQTTDITGALVNRVNAVVAEKGSINLVGMAIKQNGLLSATNAIKGENGAIYLQAMSGVASDPVAVPGASSVADGAIRPAVGGGSVTFGANSLTQVNPDEGLVYNATTKAWEVPTQVDKQAFTKAKITVTGSQILVSSGATIRAKSGVISIVGSDHQEASPSVGTTAAGTAINAQPVADGSRVVVQKDATIDVSGIADYLLPMTRNFLEAKLFSIELASSPLQRKGVIYQKTITFDARQSVAVADVSGALANVGRSAQELSTTGGTVDIRADGVLATEAGSVVNIAGGSVRFADGYKTISLLRKGDTYVDVNHAKANVVYDELVTPATTLRKELGYTDGKNAGKATFVAPLTSLKGKIDGHVVTGLRQRNDGMAGASALPVAGEVTIGRTAHVEGLADVANSFSNTKIIFNAPRTGAAATGSWLLDPLTGSTAGAASEVQLTPDLFMAGGIGTLNLYAQAIEFNAGQQLDLGTKGVFNAKGLTVDFNGDVRAAGGSITLGAQHGSVTLGEQARLTVAGAWANDRVDGLRSGPLALDGGTVSLLASNVVSTAAGSQVDASAGAWVSGNGAIKKGAAGAITVASDVNLSTEVPGGRLSKDIDGTPLGELNLKGQLLAYGFSAGGSLTLQGARLGIGAVQDAGLNLAEDYFSKGGFGSFTLKSWDTFKVAAGAKVHAVLSNQMLSQRALTASSAQTVSSVVDYLKLPDASQRKAVSLDLQAQKSVTVLGANASVDIGKDALIETEAGGSIKLTATQNVLVAGQLIAPGGSIGLNITGARGDLTKPANGTAPADKIGELDPTQAIWLTDTAVLDVHGTSKTTVDALGRDAGSVLGGGTVSLNAARGYVIAQEGSVIDLSGVSASNVLLSGQSSVQTVNKAAGTLNLSTPEGFALEGTIKAGTPGFADLGGTINATVSVGDTAYGPGYPSGAKAARSIVIDPNAAPVVSASLPKAGTSDIEKLIDNGRGVVSTSLLKDAGFAEINLAADDQIDFAGKVDLSAARSIKLDTRALVNASASSVTLAAPVVTLGNVARSAQAAAVRSYDTQAEQAASTAGLAVHAGLIDLVGEFGLKGFSAVDLLATRALDGRDTRTDGEIRLRGRAPLLGTALSGQLNFAGLLAMQAGQIYADSMSVYTIEGKAGSTFTTLMPEDGSSSLTPLSALGALTIHATTINHKGQITQPFGTIDLNADTLLTLGANSLLSVAATGTVVPLGTTVNQASWYYSPVGAAEGTAQVSQTLGALPRAKQITLHGSTQVVDKSARVSAAGGGDIQAWEFIAGVGGPTDYLAGKDLYAVLPTYKFNFAPFDAEVMSGNTALGSSSPSVGKQVVINQSAAGLAAGTYTLLPARYALLPGAYLVSLASDGGKSTLRGVIGNEDSSSIASGYYTNAGVSTAGAQGQRLLVQPSSAFLPKAQYATTSINKLLANQATRQGESRPELPMDAGRISLSASHAFDWRASFDLSAVEAGARAGQFDLALPKIELVDTDEQAAAALEKGYAPIMASALSSMKASSVLLGGTRSGSDANTTVKVVASEVELAAHHQAVELPELLAVSTNSVTVDEGVTLKASGNADGSERTINVVGDAAILAVSNRIGTSLIHSGAARKTGDLIIGSGASFDAPAVQVDASRLLNLGSSLSFDSLQSFGIAAQHLALGAPSQAVAGLTVIDGALLESLKSLSVLSLRSYSSIDLYGSQQFTSLAKDGSLLTKRLVIDSPTIRGMDASTSEFAAEQVVLRNSSKLKPDGAVSGQGAISIMAKPLLSPLATGGLVSADGDQSWAFNTVSLASTGDLILSGEGTFKAQGDLALQAARVTATSLADKTISAANLLTVQAASANAHTMGERVGQGASVNFDAQTIVQQGWIDLSSGQLAFHAAGVQDGVDSLVFDTGSKTWATGFSVQTTDTNTFYGDGGSITAQALKGNIVVKGELDVSAAAGGGNAGALQLLAGGIADQVKLGEQAVLKGQSAHGLSGQFVLDAGGVRQLNADGEAPGSVNQVDALMETVAQGGFQREIDLRIRQGDVNLSEKVTAQRLFASVDAGSLTLNGQIDARAADGGVVQLFARDDLTLNGRIDARSTRAGANGGDVLLGSDLGLLSIGAKASVDARRDSESAGATYGRVILRARRDDTNPLQAVAVSIAPDALASLKAGEITVEAVKVYAGNYTALAGGISSSSANGLALGQADIERDLGAFTGRAEDLRVSLFGEGASSNQHVRAGYEVRSTNALNLSGWDLQANRDAESVSEPINLTIRAAKDLNVLGSISDGFNGDGSITYADGASLRLVAGADLTAANVLATSANTAAGNLNINAGTVVRTTSGSIEVASAGDINFKAGGGLPPASVYVAGKLTKVDVFFGLDPYVNAPNYVAGELAQFTGQGGRLEAHAGRDVISEVQAAQSAGTYLTRSMGGLYVYVGPDQDLEIVQTTPPVLNPDSGVPEQDPYNYLFSTGEVSAWWSNFANFAGSFGSFGGGSLYVAAGRDVKNIQATVPTSARQIALFDANPPVGEASPTPRYAADKLSIENGGNLTVRAGGDILGGTYLVGRGEGLLSATGKVSDGTAAVKDGATAPALSLMEGNWNVHATDAITIAGISNPSILPQFGNKQRAMSFLSYSPDSALTVVSAASGVTWNEYIPTDAAGSALLGTKFLGDQNKLYGMATPIVRVGALGGDLKLNVSTLVLAPSSLGDIDLYAANDLAISGGQLVVSDVAPTRMPSLDRPTAGELLRPEASAVGEPDPSELMMFASSDTSVAQVERYHEAIHAGQSQVASIVAGGSIHDVGGKLIDIPMPATIEAGQDITLLNYRGEQFAETDVTRIAAGRNLTAATKQVLDTAAVQSAIKLAGAGLLDVSAGRQLDLGDSAGIQTTGLSENSNLPAQGASIKVSAATAASLNWSVFNERYLADGSSFVPQADVAANRQALIAFVASTMKLDASTLSFDQAQAYFQAMKPATQTQFAKGLMSAEFGKAYLTAGGDATVLANWLSSFKTALKVDDATLAKLTSGDSVLSIYKKGMTDAFGSTTPAAAGGYTAGWQQAVAKSLGHTLAEIEAAASSNDIEVKKLYTNYQAALRLSSGAVYEGYRAAVRKGEVGHYAGWQLAVAQSLGHTVAEIEAVGSDPALYKAYQAALSTFSGPLYERYRDAVLMGEVQRAGSLTAVVAQKTLRTPLFSLAFAGADMAGVGESFSSVGDLSLTNSTVQTRAGGGIGLFATGGDINVGLPKDTGSSADSFTRGVLTYAGGDISAFVGKEFQVNSSRVISVGTGYLTIWSSDGSIDSGRGANTDVTIPPPRKVTDPKTGEVTFKSDVVTSGKGLQGASFVYLVAPRGEVRAQDAFVKAGANLIVSAQAILAPAGNLQAPSTSGVAAAPVAPTLAAPSSPLATDATAAGAASGQTGNNQPKDRKSMLTVDLLGLGDAPGAGPADGEADDKPCVKGDTRAKCQGNTN